MFEAISGFKQVLPIPRIFNNIIEFMVIAPVSFNLKIFFTRKRGRLGKAK